jgi:hypothetical protein
MFLDSRLFHLTSEFLSDPIMIFLNDESANHRMTDIVGSFLASKNYYFFINFFDNYSEQMLKFYNDHSFYIHPYTFNAMSDRAMTGTGQAFFDIGIYSILYYFIIYKLSFKCFKSKKKAFYLSFCLFILMTTAIPYSTPMFGFIFGLLAFKARTESSKKLK